MALEFCPVTKVPSSLLKKIPHHQQSSDQKPPVVTGNMDKIPPCHSLFNCLLPPLVELVFQVIYEKLVDLTGNPAVPLVLVGNKSDLHGERAVTEAAGKKLAADMKVSVMEAMGVMELTGVMESIVQGVPLKSTPLNFLSVRPNCEIREKKLRVSDFIKGCSRLGT